MECTTAIFFSKSNFWAFTFGLSNPLQNYGWLLLDEIYRSLGISKVFRAHKKETSSQIDLDKSMRLLMAKRILDPQSKRKSVQSQRDLFGDFDLALRRHRLLDEFWNSMR